MKKLSHASPSRPQEKDNTLSELKEKLDLQNSAIKKLNDLLVKPKKALIWLSILCLGTQAFAQSVTMTWVDGEKTANEAGVYGTIGLEPSDVSPGSRTHAATVKSGNDLWLFGGEGFDKNGNEGYLSDLWKWDGVNWILITGHQTRNEDGVYGTKGTASSNNHPGGRRAAQCWVDASGDFWLFGGYGKAKATHSGYLNDLWKWDGTNWTWISGSDTADHYSIYGTRGTTSSTSIPGAREKAFSYMDGSGNFWVFGGFGWAGNNILSTRAGGLNDLWKWDGSNWTWMHGHFITYDLGVYGTRSVTTSSDYPRSRHDGACWTDTAGNFWIFGGESNLGYHLNDLWKWDGTNWTWILGSTSTNRSGTYNTQGIHTPGNYPGSRKGCSATALSTGEVLLFGGEGYAAYGGRGLLNDLWIWDGGIKWIWLSGADHIDDTGNFGTKGASNATNLPMSKMRFSTWADANDNFWVFGGYGKITITGSPADKNILWKWNGSQWSWIAGSKEKNVAGLYATSSELSSRKPGARKAHSLCTDSDGNVWMYGGEGYDKNGNEGHLGDLWKKDAQTGYWTCLKGSDERNPLAVYGTQGNANSNNTPGQREGAIIWAHSGEIWLFGGKYEASGTDHLLNDLWQWNGNNWKWVAGSSSSNASGIYSGGSSAPGARIGSAGWVDNSNKLWLFGGYGYDKNGDLGRLNDLWKYNGSNWVLKKGADVKNAATTYGTKGVSTSTSTPGGRNGTSYWKDTDGNFWLLGGDGNDANGNYGSFNDVWKWDGTNWTWMLGSGTRNASGVYGDQYEPTSSNLPGARKAALSWQDDKGFIWVLGGYGYDQNGDVGRLNDVWVHNGSNWTWLKGANTRNANATYNTQNSSNFGSIIGARSAGAAFELNNTVYILGGVSRDENGNTGSFNDLWKIESNYSIEKNKNNKVSYQELSIWASQSSGNALQNAGDRVEITSVVKEMTEVSTNLPPNSNLAFRYDKKWTLSKNDLNSNGGTINLSFDLGSALSSDYSYYLLERSGTTGAFSTINNLNYRLDGNRVIFTCDLSQINTGYQYSIGRSSTGSGYALNFDKSTLKDYVGLSLNQSPHSAFTIECWFKTDAIGSKQVLVAQNDGIGDGRPLLRIDANGAITTKLGNVSTTSLNRVVANKWYHVALVYDGFFVSLYLNGKPEFQFVNVSGELATGDWILGTTKSGADGFDGELDELRVWNDERTLTEIIDNMHHPLKGDESNLTAYYKFDQHESMILPDVSQNANRGVLLFFSLTGTNSNWVTSTCPVVDRLSAKNLAGAGNCIDFDGTDDYIKLTDLKLNPDNGNGFTAEAWIYHQPSGTSLDHIFSQENGTGNGRTLLWIESNGKLASFLNAQYNAGSVLVPSDEWTHIALSYNGTQAKIYVNGILDVSFTEGAESADGSWILAARNNGTTTFEGKIDDVRIWSDERTQTEIQDNMYATLTGDEGNLEAFYDFNSESGLTLSDKTSNSYDGTLNNMSSWQWYSATDREPFKTVRAGAHSSNNTWKGGTAPSTSTDKLAVFHDLNLSSTATYSRLHVNSGKTVTTDADITVTGEVIVNGTANGLSKVILNGSSKQSLGGSGSLRNLEVNNGNDVSLEGDLSITGSLTLTSGDIEVNDRTLTISEFLFGGSASSYLKINGSGVVKTTVGSSPVTLPIGRNPYLPILIDDGGNAEFTVGVAEKVYDNPLTQANEQTTLVITETWSIQASSAVDDVNVTLQWDAAQEASGFNRSQVHLAYWESGVSSLWNPSSQGVANGSGPYTLSRTIDFTTNPYYLGVGSSGSLLPVELSYFNVEWLASTPLSNPIPLSNPMSKDTEQSRSNPMSKDTERSRSDLTKSALLTWTTASETNNSHFEIQRAFGTLSGAEGWESIEQVQGQGTSHSSTNYSFEDQLETKSSSLQTIYYRLKQVDYSGQFEYSPVRTLSLTEQSRSQNFSVYPNPAQHFIYFSESVDFRLYNLQGEVLITGSDQRVNTSSLPSGYYMLETMLNDQPKMTKVLVQ